MFGRLSIALFAATSLSLASAAVAKGDEVKKPLDPNEKICETTKVVGSRLATRKICATRAEWADYRRQDRDAIDKAQRVTCMRQDQCVGN